MFIQERILQYLDYKEVTPYRFCKDLKFSMGYLDKRGGIGTDKYLRIIEAYPDLNPEWLLTGRGSMLREQKQYPTQTQEPNTAHEPAAPCQSKFSKIKMRILEYADLKQLSKRRIYLETGISNGVLDKETGLSENNIEKFISTYVEVSPEWLLTGKGPMLKSETVDATEKPQFGYSKERQLSRGMSKSVPYYDIQAVAGNSGGADMTPQSEANYNIDLPAILGDAESALRIFGNSMLPNYPSGCIVGLRQVRDNIIDWGNVYVIETRFDRYLKRLYKAEDGVTCYSDNTDTYKEGARKGLPLYETFNISSEEIVKIHKVVGVIRRIGNVSVF